MGSLAAARGSQVLEFGFHRRKPFGEPLVFEPRIGGHLFDRFEFLACDEVLGLQPPFEHKARLRFDFLTDGAESRQGAGRSAGQIVEDFIVALHGRNYARGRGGLQRSRGRAYKRRMIVVTGGAGFIGSNLLAGLEAHGARELVCVDWFGSGDKWKNVAKRALVDVLPPEDLPAFLAARKGRIETVFHMGANSATTETDVDSIVRTNIRATLDLWDWCAANGAAFVYASSAATYGDGTLGFDDDPSPEALAKLRPLNPYGWSKHLVDRRFAAAARDPKTPRPRQQVGLKFFNVYGPNEAHKGPMRSVVHQVHPVAARGEAFPLFRSHRPDVPDGGQTRDFVWVGDVVDVMLWLRDHPKVSGLFNLGSGKGRSFLDLATAVYAALGKNAAIAWRDTPEAIRDKYQYFTEAKMDRLRAAGYARSFTPLEEGVRKYVLDHLVKDDPYV